MQGEEFLSPSAIPALRAFFGERYEGAVIPDPADVPAPRLVLSAFVRPDFFSKLSAPEPLTAARREMVLEKRQWRAGRLGGFFWGRAGMNDPAPPAATESIARAELADRMRSRPTREDAVRIIDDPVVASPLTFDDIMSGLSDASPASVDLAAVKRRWELLQHAPAARAVVSWMIARARRARAA